MRLLLHLLLLGTVVCQLKMSYSATLKCTADGGTLCTAWTISMVLQQDIACFPSDQKVVTENGIKKMSQLNVGDRVLGYDQQLGLTYTPIRSWLHRLDGQSYFFQYRKIEVQSGLMYISAMHNIGIANNEGQLDYIFAKDVTPSHKLFGINNSIISNQLEIKAGLYAPLTQSFNFYVSLSEQKQIFALVHCFAHIANPTFFEDIYFYLEIISQTLGIISHRNNQNGISEFNLMLMKLFPNFFIETPIIQNIYTKDGTIVYDTFSTVNSNNDNQQQQENRISTIATFILLTIHQQFY